MSKATIKMCPSTTGFGPHARDSGPEDNKRSRIAGQRSHGEWTRLDQQQTYQPTDGVGMHHRSPVEGFAGYGGQAFRTTSDEWTAPHGSDSRPQPPTYPPINEDTVVEQEASICGSMQTIVPSELDRFNIQMDDLTANTGLEFLMMDSDSMMYDSELGMNLGFGNEHDWSDGAQLDLFDGFFLGNGNTGSTVM